MNVKIETKEKFTVLIPQDAIISANMTEDLQKLAGYATQEIPHLVLNMTEVIEIAPIAARKIAAIQQEFYERNHSFVVCGLQKSAENVFEVEELTEIMNITPTESEAGDIVQMEEIERELMSDLEEEEKP